MSYRERVRNSIKDHQTKVRTFWEVVTQRSAEYVRALQLTEHDLEVLEDMQGNADPSLLQLRIDGVGFSLYVKNVCGSYYGDTWRRCVMATSPTHPGLNQECGGGTTHAVHLSADAHRKLILKLKD